MLAAVIAALIPWVAHPEVWVLIGGGLAVGIYAARVIQPKALDAGYEGLTSTQISWFVAGLIGLWVASDWPVHDIAEDHLYSVHMGQHLVISLLIPAAFVLATPRWLLELVLQPHSRAWRWLRKGSKPLFAGIVFNAVTALLHLPQVVQLAADSGVAHYLMHLLVFGSGILLWMPVIGPIKEWRLQPLGQCIYLFCNSLLPTIPGGWLVFATGVVYPHYDTPERLWGVSLLTDQQAAGAIMKLAGGFFIWIVIFVIFGRWASRDQVEQHKARAERDRIRYAAFQQKQFRESQIQETPG